MYISHVNTVAKACLFTAEFSQLSIFTADCLRHPIQMVGIETIWELRTLIVMNSWSTPYIVIVTLIVSSIRSAYFDTLQSQFL